MVTTPYKRFHGLTALEDPDLQEGDGVRIFKVGQDDDDEPEPYYPESGPAPASDGPGPQLPPARRLRDSREPDDESDGSRDSLDDYEPADDEARGYLAAQRQWRREHGLPERPDRRRAPSRSPEARALEWQRSQARRKGLPVTADMYMPSNPMRKALARLDSLKLRHR